VAREKDEIETVLNFIDTIFYGDTGHRLVTPSGGTCPEFCPVGTLWRMKFQAFLSWFSRNRLLLDDSAGKPVAGDLIGTAGLRWRRTNCWRGRDAQLGRSENRARGATRLSCGPGSGSNRIGL
jgi:hypothetical protein